MVTCVAAGAGVGFRLELVVGRLAVVMGMGTGDLDLSGLGIRVDDRRLIARRMFSHYPAVSKTSRWLEFEVVWGVTITLRR
jgi:hypothetical protein